MEIHSAHVLKNVYPNFKPIPVTVLMRQLVNKVIQSHKDYAVGNLVYETVEQV